LVSSHRAQLLEHCPLGHRAFPALIGVFYLPFALQSPQRCCNRSYPLVKVCGRRACMAPLIYNHFPVLTHIFSSYEYSATVSPPGQEGTYLSLSQACPSPPPKTLNPLCSSTFFSHALKFPLFAAPLVAGIMSGDLLTRYCPRRGQCDPFQLWFWIAVVSMASPLLMVLFSPFLRTQSHEESSAENMAGNEQVSSQLERTESRDDLFPRFDWT
jgi:hypothetical protein